MLVTNHGHEAKLHNATEHASSNIGTARVVAKVFGQNFFAAVWSRNARLDRYLRNGESLTEYRMRRASCASDFLHPQEVAVYSG